VYSTGNEAVDLVGTMNLEGNIIPHSWYSQFKFQNGQPDFLSMLILSEVVYWYRPTYVRDEQSGVVLQVKKKFRHHALQKSYKDLTAMFGVSVKQIREALERLEEKGLVKRDFLTMVINGEKKPNMMFLLLNAENLRKLTYPHLFEEAPNEAETLDTPNDEGGSLPPGKYPPSPQGSTVIPPREGGSLPPGKDGPSPQGSTNTKNTTKTTTKITTKNKTPYGEFVSLSENEHASLIEKYGQQQTDEMIEMLDNYKGASGKKYNSDYRAILSWVVKRWQEEHDRGKTHGKAETSRKVPSGYELPF
jgi:DNA-binding Lrp family transcriptional regulator